MPGNCEWGEVISQSFSQEWLYRREVVENPSEKEESEEMRL